MLKAHAKRLRRLTAVADAGVAASICAAVLTHPIYGAKEPDGFGAALLTLVATGALVWPVALRRLGLYGSIRRIPRAEILSRLAVAGCVATAVMALTVLALGAPVAGSFPFLCGALQLFALATLREVALQGLYFLRRRGRNYRNFIVVGSGPRARHVLDSVARRPEWGLRIVGFVDDSDIAVDPYLEGQKIYKLQDFPAVLRNHVIDEVLVACPRSLLTTIMPIVATCAETGVPITLLSDLFGDFLPPPKVTSFDSLAAVSFAPVHHDRFELSIKRGIDIVGGSVLLVLVAPILLAASVAVRVTSPGQILFRQARCGMNGRPFQLWKLRTMCEGAEMIREEFESQNVMDGPVFKIPDDPRVTRVGHVLRRWSIDELPQVWNVLKGDMSLVGPRPALPTEVVQYGMAQRRRLSMRPGLTCLWQVSGRNQIGFADWVKLDLEYIDNWSLGLDFKLLLRTIPAVIRGTGAT